jgi:hypothetical protein
MNICTSNMDGDISKSSFSKRSILVKTTFTRIKFHDYFYTGCGHLVSKYVLTENYKTFCFDFPTLWAHGYSNCEPRGRVPEKERK